MANEGEIFGNNAKVLETISIGAALGLRFWDPVRDMAVTEDLAVSARPYNFARPLRQAVRAPSGHFLFPRLPGVNVDTVPLSRRFLVRVDHLRDHFLPAAFEIRLPLNYTGMYRPSPIASPPDFGQPGIYLFSAPARPVQPQWAVIRARLWDQALNRGAALAILEITPANGEPAFGIADGRGEAVVFLDYPRFGMPLMSSPPLPGTGDILDQNWNITVRVRYQPGSLIFPPNSGLPEFTSVRAQGPAKLYPAQVPEMAWSTTLNFRRELVLRTQGSDVLRVEP